MKISYTAGGFKCHDCGGGPRGRWADGYWTDICKNCVEKIRKTIADWKSQKNKIWFLGGKK